MAPLSATPAQTANAPKKRPVAFTTNPVMADAATPARFATNFCRPLHFPAARGPARVCVIAQWLDEKMPYDIHASSSRIIDAVRLGRTVTPIMMVAKPSPKPVQVLRTRVGATPAAIARSDNHPAAMVATADTTYAKDPIEAISLIEKWPVHLERRRLHRLDLRQHTDAQPGSHFSGGVRRRQERLYGSREPLWYGVLATEGHLDGSGHRSV